MTKKAVVLNSGGLDSATCLAIATAEGFEITALTFDYGQRHNAELKAAQHLAQHFQVKDHRIVTLPISQWSSSSSLTNVEKVVPRHGEQEGIPTTYVPARNTIFLSIALSVAESIEAFDIFTGVNAVDYSGYTDCRPEYIHAFQVMANLATKTGVEGKSIIIRTPLIHWSKSEIIRQGTLLKVPYEKSVSCYQADAQGRACGHCDSCAFRKKGFKEAGVTDPTHYRETT